MKTTQCSWNTKRTQIRKHCKDPPSVLSQGWEDKSCEEEGEEPGGETEGYADPAATEATATATEAEADQPDNSISTIDDWCNTKNTAYTTITKWR